MDAVHHLDTRNTCTRTLWCAIIIIFVVLALIQIYSQIVLYYSNPVATNIEAEYPKRIAFPTVAICNNNQYRLTYITGGRVMNRRHKPISGSLKSIGHASATVFDTVMRRAWDMDAVKFLRNSAHWKSRMILGCTWPNGTSCKLSDFKAVWTTTGLCWAINTDPHNPFEVTGSGAGHGLRLLLNVESYERVDACTKHFRTNSLPGLKILIYNQTDVPESSLNGVNVPSGYSMDIPFKMQHRHKLPGVHCVQETDEHKQAEEDFDSVDNIRTCALRQYMAEVETACQCTMRRAFTNKPSESGMAACTVDDYFGCVQPAMKRVREEGTASSCLPPCESVDYTAWQDMNRLPQNIMPAVITETEQEDEDDVEEDNIDEEKFISENHRGEETFSCEDSAFLSEQQVTMIKMNAHRAFEKQSRHQEDIFLRSRRLIARLRNSIQTISKLKFGWHSDDFVSVYDRMAANVSCFANFSSRHEDIVAILDSRPLVSEEKKASQIYFLLDEDGHKKNSSRYKSIGDLKSRFGDRVDDVSEEITIILRMMEKLWHLFMESSYQRTLPGDFSRMDRIIELMDQYELNKLQRRAWAEKMQSRQMRHFFDEDFYDAYYQPILRDLDQTLVKTIEETDADWANLQIYIKRGTASKTGAMLFFGDSSRENREKFAKLVMEMHECSSGKMRKESTRLLNSFKKAYRELQAAYNKLFKEELPDYLENFEFGNKFVGDNFAMVNIFLHKMHLERWSQDRVYGFWSLACDVGGALGLFLGVSLLTIIELIYLCIQYGFCGKRARNFSCFASLNKMRLGDQCAYMCGNCCKNTRDNRKKSQSYQRRFTNEEEDERGTPSEEIYNRSKKSIWNEPKGGHNTMTPEEMNHFLDQVRRQSQPPPRHEYPSNESVHKSTKSLEETPILERNSNFLSPDYRNDRLADISEENSRSDRRPSEEKQIPDRHSPPIEFDPVSVSEVSDSTAAPALFGTKSPRQSDI